MAPCFCALLSQFTCKSVMENNYTSNNYSLDSAFIFKLLGLLTFKDETVQSIGEILSKIKDGKGEKPKNHSIMFRFYIKLILEFLGVRVEETEGNEKFFEEKPVEFEIRFVSNIYAKVFSVEFKLKDQERGFLKTNIHVADAEFEDALKTTNDGFHKMARLFFGHATAIFKYLEGNPGSGSSTPKTPVDADILSSTASV